MFRPLVILSIAMGISSSVLAFSHTDTVVKKHVTDAVLDDWQPQLFETHQGSGIKYAVQNSTDKLYLAIQVADQDVQRRIMLTGMYLFIDTKGKKKESTNIEFPIQKSVTEIAAFMPRRGSNNAGFDSKAFRDQMIGSMLFLKRTGFIGQQTETELQSIDLPNEISLSFGWDESNIMYIEYEVPLSRLGTAEALINKNISLGFELRAVDLSSSFSAQPVQTTTRIVAVPAGTRPSSNSRTGGGDFRANQASSNSNISKQSFWIKHQMN